jgi:hypothetical protein
MNKPESSEEIAAAKKKRRDLAIKRCNEWLAEKRFTRFFRKKPIHRPSAG